MNRRKAIVGISLASFASAQTKQPAIREKFLGVWKLVGYESTDKATGEVRYPYSSNPVGRLTYDAAGRMSAQLMNPRRLTVGGSPTLGSAASIRAASADDMRAILSGFIAYFGTFDIDEPARTVIHHVEACLIPSWVGTDLRRTYEFAGGNQLTLTAPSERVVTRLVWQRDSA
jgi:hypothetical protein